MTKDWLARIVAVARHPVTLWPTALVFTVWALMRITRFRVDAPAAVWGDAGIVYDRSLEILHSAHYPASLVLGNFNDVFPYPPPAALIFGGIASLGAPLFMSLWVVAMVVALFAAFRFSVVTEPTDVRRSFVALMPAVIVLCHNPIDYDLLNANNNLIVLALVMGSFALMPRAPSAAGVLLALPIALKLYSATLLLWALIYRPRVAVACVIALCALWLFLPWGIFGAKGFAGLYRGWFDQLTIVNDPWVYTLTAGSGPPLISLRRAAAWFTGSPPYANASAVLLSGLQAIWIAVLAVYAMIVWRFGRVSATSRAALADWAVLLLAPLPFSPWLEPYHAVGMIPALVLHIVVLFDTAAPRRARMIAAAICLLVLVTRIIATPFDIRGAVFLIQFALLVLGLGTMRRFLSAETAVISPPVHAAVGGGRASTE